MVLRTRQKKGIVERIKDQLAKIPVIGKRYDLYGVKVWIYEDYGGGGSWKVDEAGRFTYENREVYELKSDGTELQAPDYSKLMRDPEGNPLLVLYSPEMGVFHPMTIDKENYQFDVEEGNWVQWMSNQMRQKHEEWKMEDKKWYEQQWVPHVAMGIFIFLTMLGFTYYWQNGLTEITGMVDALKEPVKQAAAAQGGR